MFEIVIGSVMARNLKVAVGDELTLLGSGFDGSFAAGVVTVVGVFESGSADIDRSFAELPLAYFQDLFTMAGQGHSIGDIGRRTDAPQGRGLGEAFDLLPGLAFSEQLRIGGSG